MKYLTSTTILFLLLVTVAFGQSHPYHSTITQELAIYTNSYQISVGDDSELTALQLNAPNKHQVFSDVTTLVNSYSDIQYIHHWILWEDNIYRSAIVFGDELFSLYYGEPTNRLVIMHFIDESAVISGDY